jgi:hypothetical protein
MRYSDELAVEGRLFRIEAGSVRDADPEAFELSVRADDAGGGPVEVRALLPAAELAVVGEIVQHSLAGLARLAGGAGTTVGGERFKVRIAAARQRHPKAWTSWTSDDDSRLMAGYQSGVSLDKLAEELGRGPRAIVSRLVKHGVVAQRPASDTGEDAG